MCIRDRVYRYSIGIKRNIFSDDGIFTIEPKSYHASYPDKKCYIDHYGSCLLYTSDAADERSSVDLGGRRIIKKKKNTHEKTQHKHHNKSQHKNKNVTP